MSILIHRNGENEGPYDLAQIQEGLSTGYFTPDIYAYTDGFTEWVPLQTLLDSLTPPPATAITRPAAENRVAAAAQAAALPADRIDQALAKFLGDEQDPKVVDKIYRRAQELLTAGEEVKYIGVQKKPVVTIAPDAIVLTNKRFMIVKPKLTGMTFEDYPWRNVANVHLSEQLLGATITCETTDGIRTAIDSIPKKQARKIYTFAQEIEEQMVEVRRHREMEEMRAAAGGVVIQGMPGSSAPAASEDPVAVLGKLKQLLDAGLVTPAEYEAKKAEVLAKM